MSDPSRPMGPGGIRPIPYGPPQPGKPGTPGFGNQQPFLQNRPPGAFGYGVAPPGMPPQNMGNAPPNSQNTINQAPMMNGPPPMWNVGQGPPVPRPPVSMINGMPPSSQPQLNGSMNPGGLPRPPLPVQGFARPPQPGAPGQMPPSFNTGLPRPDMAQRFGAPPSGQSMPPSSMSSPAGPPRMLPPGPTMNTVPGPPMPGPPRMGGPPSTGAPPSGPPSSMSDGQTNSGRPNELPVPFHGKAQYSHQVNTAPDNIGLTPSSSEPPSQKSSRAPSPVPGPQYDALEGQFTPSSSGPPGIGSLPSQPRYPPPPTSMFQGSAQAPPLINQGPPHLQGPPMNQGPPLAMNQGPALNRGPPSMGSQYTNQGPPPPSNQGPPMMNQGPPMNTHQGPLTSATGPGMYPPPPGTQGGPMGDQHGMGVPSSQGTGFPPSSSQSAGITGKRVHPQMMGGTAPGPIPPPGQPMDPMAAQPQYQQQNSINSQFNNMRLQPDMSRPVNLLQEKNILPPEGLEVVKPNLPNDFKKVNCHPDIFRCTLNALPNTQSLLNKSRLPLGIMIHPFKDLSQLPVIQSSVIVRCRSCRTYINPFVTFVDVRRWKCNLCYRVNELPEEFNYDPVSKTYGEPQRRPEIKSSTIEFIAPSEYMLRPPQAAVYLYLLDVSFNAIGTGYLPVFCQTLLEELDRIPGDNRTQIGFITYDSALHFYNLSEGQSQPQMMIVSDVDDIFLPCPDGLLVNLNESKELVIDLLNKLPTWFESNKDTGSALGPALQAAYKLMTPTGGRVTVVQTTLPTVGPGALKNREDPNERAGKKIANLGPATDFYKKLSLEYSAQQIAADLFMLNSQYADLSTVAGISKYSGGYIHYLPGFHTVKNPSLTDRLDSILRRYFTRKIGFEAVMRIRCSRGLSLHTFHGNFFVRSTDLLSLPNINPDAGFGMQMSIDDTIDANYTCFQAALLYTSSKGERRIRVHTLCLPVTKNMAEIHANADQQAIVSLIAKMAVDKSLTSSMGDARDALVNAAVDMLGAYGGTLTQSQRMGQLPVPHTLRMMPLYLLAILKSTAFRTGTSTKLDDRVFALEECKSLPVSQLLLTIYPDLYPVHNLDDRNAISKGDSIIPQPCVLQLSSAYIDRHGAYVLDSGTHMYMWVGAAISDKFCQEVFDVPNFQSIQDGICELPELENHTSERLRNFISHLNDSRPFAASFSLIREDSRNRMQFLERMIEDRSESTFSYYEFLQHLQKEVKTWHCRNEYHYH